MRWPGALGSVVVHGLVVGLALFTWPKADREIAPVSSVPVSVISETLIEAAAPDNPSEELVETPLEATEPTPPPPTPTPPPPSPRPTPSPQPPTQKTQPRPPEKTPPRPPQKTQPTPPRKEEPGLDLGSLRPDRNAPQRPPAGQQGQGQAPRAIGPMQLQALAREITPYWRPPCDIPGGNNLTIRVRVRLSESGRVMGRPTFDNPRSDSLWQAASQGMASAIAQAEPFNVPQGFTAQEVPFRFETSDFCRNR